MADRSGPARRDSGALRAGPAAAHLPARPGRERLCPLARDARRRCGHHERDLDAVKRFPRTLHLLRRAREKLGTLRDRSASEHLPMRMAAPASWPTLAVWPELRDAVASPGSIVIDPDSRLTQLGLLPVCAEEDYYFFESRSYGGDSRRPCPSSRGDWVAETRSASRMPSRSSLRCAPRRIRPTLRSALAWARMPPSAWQARLKQNCCGFWSSAIVDPDRPRGGRGRSRAGGARDGPQRWAARFGMGRLRGSPPRSPEAISTLVTIRREGTWRRCGVPLISIFGGFVSERMFQRWRPTGDGAIHVIRAAAPMKPWLR